MTTTVSPPRALRGLIAGLLFSVVNLLGGYLTILALGGLDEWSAWQFVGLFGVLETGTGLAFIICPNIWRLPVAEANTSDRTAVQLAVSTVLIPHWAAGAKAVAGLVLLVLAAVNEGVGPATTGVPILVLLVLGVAAGLSILAARLGVARPDLDVVFIAIRRPGREERALPGISISASVVQLVINVGTYPAVKLLPPSVLYRPEIGPSPELLGIATAFTGAVLLLAYLAWRGRMRWRAPREQQREAEKFA